MDLYLISRDRRRPAPLGMAVLSIIGIIIWAFTAQGRAAAYSAEGPTETAAKPNSIQAHAIEDNDLDDDFNANGGGGGDSDSSGGDDSSGGGASAGGDQDSSGGDDSSGDGDSVGEDSGDHDSSGGDDSSGDGDSVGEDTTSDGGTPPAGNNPPPAANNPPPAQGTLGSSSGPPVVMLPDTAMATADGAGTLVAGLAALALAGAVAVRRIARFSKDG